MIVATLSHPDRPGDPRGVPSKFPPVSLTPDQLEIQRDGIARCRAALTKNKERRPPPPIDLPPATTSSQDKP